MSKVFSFDKTSTRMASSMAKHHSQNPSQLSHIRQSKSQARTGGYGIRNGQPLHMQLTINPTSNASLQHRPNVVNLKDPQRQKRYRFINMTSGAMLSPNVISGQFNSQGEYLDVNNLVNASANFDITNNGFADFKHGMILSPTMNHDPEVTQTPLVETLIAQRNQQRVGLKTAEGSRKRPRHLTKAQQSIDLNNKFQGFDRRQTHDKMLKKVNLKMKNKRGNEAAYGRETFGTTIDSQDMN